MSSVSPSSTSVSQPKQSFASCSSTSNQSLTQTSSSPISPAQSAYSSGKSPSELGSVNPQALSNKNTAAVLDANAYSNTASNTSGTSPTSSREGTKVSPNFSSSSDSLGLAGKSLANSSSSSNKTSPQQVTPQGSLPTINSQGQQPFFAPHQSNSSSTVSSNQQQSGQTVNSNRPFYTRNRRERPCDGCRRRKTRCLRPDGAVICTMCVSHNEVCTFVLEPPTRRRQPASSTQNPSNPPTSLAPIQPSPVANGTHDLAARTQQQQQQQLSASLVPSRTLLQQHPQQQLQPQPQIQSTDFAPHDMHSIMDQTLLMGGPRPEIHHMDDHGLGLSSKRIRLGVENDAEHNNDNGSDIMDPSSNASSLGMNESAYSELIGPNVLDHEYQFVHRLSVTAGDKLQLSKSNYLRPVSNDAIFLMTIDNEIEEDHKLVEEIEQIVHPYGPQLVNLYFRIVHPSYPIIHKTYFLSQYKVSPKNISPPLLAAVYSLALNWWTYDHDLSQSDTQPDSLNLDSISFAAIQRHLHRARLATVQAGLLLLQRKPESIIGGLKIGRTQISAFTAQLVGVAHALGLHLDCSKWHIPSWEIPLRRRVAWALYVQDRWVALCHGRPSYIDDKNWLVPMLDLDDFCAELSINSGPDDPGAELLIETSKLTSILSEILLTFFFSEYTKYKHEIRDAQVVFELAKPLQLKLRQWHSGLSDCLYMKPTNVVNKRLCTTGYLHLAYYTVEITLHRAILRALEGCTDGVVIMQFRTAANDRAKAAVNFVKSLSAEYLEAFWIHSSRDCLVEIGQFIALLEVTAKNEDEVKLYKEYKEGFQWHLRVHSRAAWMFEYALLRLEKVVWSIFEAVPSVQTFHMIQRQQQQQQEHMYLAHHQPDLKYIDTSALMVGPPTQAPLLSSNGSSHHQQHQLTGGTGSAVTVAVGGGGGGGGGAGGGKEMKVETALDIEASVSDFWNSPSNSVVEDGSGSYGTSSGLSTAAVVAAASAASASGVTGASTGGGGNVGGGSGGGGGEAGSGNGGNIARGSTISEGANAGGLHSEHLVPGYDDNMLFESDYGQLANV
ncbi:fungal-specific transcription factor domain-containing protein [Lipomyces oligophaga]|uniref:fungal-specific transcription factor domain-containing protein n=1 Tax=Lipomyces oligophaga TaxID=45792 RepID=UPI0034CD8FCC